MPILNLFRPSSQQIIDKYIVSNLFNRDLSRKLIDLSPSLQAPGLPVRIPSNILKKIPVDYNKFFDLYYVPQQEAYAKTMQNILSGATQKYSEATHELNKHIIEQVLENMPIIKGKLYAKDVGIDRGVLHGVTKGPTVDQLVKNVQKSVKGIDPEQAKKGVLDSLNYTIKPYYGRDLKPDDIVFSLSPVQTDVLATPRGLANFPALLTASSAKKLGVDPPDIVLSGATKNPLTSGVVIQYTDPPRGSVFFPGSDAYKSGTPLHETLHSVDIQKKRLPYWLSMAGTALMPITFAGYPVAALYGDEISEKIPGSIDDKILKFFKYFGPEAMLATEAMRLAPFEYSALKGYRDIVKKDPKYFERMVSKKKFEKLEPAELRSLIGNSVENIANARMSAAFSTYPAYLARMYGIARASSIPLYIRDMFRDSGGKDIEKQSSALTEEQFRKMLYASPNSLSSDALVRQPAINQEIKKPGMISTAFNLAKGFFTGKIDMARELSDPVVLRSIVTQDTITPPKPFLRNFVAPSLIGMTAAILLKKYMQRNEERKKEPVPIIKLTNVPSDFSASMFGGDD